MPKAYSYLRFSTPEQAQGDSFRRQTEAAQRYALKAGLELDTTLNLRDAGVSAFKGLNASVGALAAFLRAVDDGDVEAGSVLLVESLDRISRQTVRRAVKTLENIVERGVSVVDLSDGERVYSAEMLDTDPFAFVMMAMRFIRAHEESALKSRRLKAAWVNKRATAESRPLTARAPAWLELTPERSWKVREERAEIVRRIFGMAAVGIGENAIASALNNESIPPFGNGSRLGKHWHRSSVAKILHNPAVSGILVPYTQDHVDGRKRRTAQEAIEGHFPVVVPHDVRDAVLALRTGTANPQRGRHANGAIQNVFGGLARCPVCGSSMTRVMKGSSPRAGRPKLVCTKAKAGAGCRYRTVPIADLEAALIVDARWIFQARGEGVMIRAIFEDGNRRATVLTMEQIQRSISNAEIRRNNLVDAIASGGSSPVFLLQIANEERTIEHLKGLEREAVRVASISDSAMLTRRFAEIITLLEAESIDRMKINVALRQVLSCVTVQYGTGLLIFEWKSGHQSVIKYGEADDVDRAPPEWRETALKLKFDVPQRTTPMTDDAMDVVMRNPASTAEAFNQTLARTDEADVQAG